MINKRICKDSHFQLQETGQTFVTFSMATVSFSLAADASLLADAMVAGAVGPLDDPGGSTAATAMSLATMAAVAAVAVPSSPKKQHEFRPSLLNCLLRCLSTDTYRPSI